MATLEEVEVALKLGILDLKGKWKPDANQREAAWEMYVELVTRISVAELGDNEGLLREALSSLHSLFETTRTILKQRGSSVAYLQEGSDFSFGYLAVAILNRELRPLLAKWHPMLLDYEHQKPADVSAMKHERAWKHNAELRKALNKIRLTLIEYANLLAEVADVPSLLTK